MPHQISKKMHQAILQIYSSGSTSDVNKATINALRNRSILSSDNVLTEFGSRCAISKLPLVKQCNELALELITVHLTFSGKPEAALLAYYRAKGYVGISIEGHGILTVLKALMLDKLAFYNTFEDRSDACARYLEAQFTILEDKTEELISSIFSTTKQRYINNFKEIISHPFITSNYPELSLEFAEAMYDAIDKTIYALIAKKFAEAPYFYRNGWPDLTLIRGKEVRFIEVKTKDKLHESQLFTIPTMRKILPFSFQVCKVVK